MTNIIATIAVFLTTNWTQVGTFHPTGGGKQTVEQATIVTNTAVRFQWEGKSFEFILSSLPGPVIGERKGPLVKDVWTNWQTNVIVPTNWTWPGYLISSNDNIHWNGKWGWGFQEARR